MNETLQLIRTQCSRANWSRGAQLMRGGAVLPLRTSEEEPAWSVAGKGGRVHQVVLLPKTHAWRCDCTEQEPVCQHVAAVAHLLKRPQEAQAKRTGHIGYRFERVDGRLALRRHVVVGRHEMPLRGSLADVGSQALDGVEIVPSEQDRRIESTLLGYTGGPIPQGMMPRILDALNDAPDIRLHNRPVKVGKPTSGLCVRVEECGLGFRLRLDKDPQVNEVFQNGAMLRGTKLRALEPHGLGERRYTELRAGKIYEGSEVGTLVGEVLPKLQLQVPVLVDTNKLPRVATMRPRLCLATERDADRLVLLATIVYGDPPRARVDGERLTLLSGTEAPVRDHDQERDLRRIAHSLGLEMGIKRGYDERMAIAAAQHLTTITDERVYIEGTGHKEFFEVGELSPKLEIHQTGDFELWFSAAELEKSGIDLAPRRAEPSAVLRAWERGSSLVPLLGGGFAPLPKDWLEKFGHRVRDLLAAREAMALEPEAPKNPTALVPELSALSEALGEVPPPNLRRLRALAQDFEELPPAKIAPKLKGILRDYQKVGVNWLSFLRDAELGGLLADDMGLGKTLQTLCAIRDKTLVVAPTSVIHNWLAEIKRFRPNLTTNMYHGPSRELKAVDVTLTTYALLRLDADKLAAETWDTVVLDEAQAIKNPGSQVAKAAFALKATFRVALTGTPVENRLDDLWSQFHFTNRGLLGSRQDFNERYVKPIASGDPDAAKRLRTRIKPFVLRRLKSEVAKELPPRTEVVLRCQLNEAERQVYDAVRAATRKDIVKKLAAESSNTLAVLEALLRLRQAASHPGLLPGQKKFKDESSSKVDLLIELLQEALEEDHKALVFSQWTSLLDLVGAQLEKNNISYSRLDGRTRDRAKVVKAFQDPGGPQLMLISLKAGGTGLNLTAADNVFLLDPWWNPAVEDQAADRAHRIGQKRPVIVHRLVAEDTVEERILSLQEKKRELAEAAVGDATMASTITRDELLALLE